MISNERLQWLSELDGYLLRTIDHLTLDLPDVFKELILLRTQRDELLVALKDIVASDTPLRYGLLEQARAAISHCES
jgi:hypothetical protein